MKDLKNKNIIVTGSIWWDRKFNCKKLNDFGANILASGTKIEKLEELKSKFNNIKILKI
jgi:3-oxoacyl-[acyl-carrier protein] reductase